MTTLHPSCLIPGWNLEWMAITILQYAVFFANILHPVAKPTQTVTVFLYTLSEKRYKNAVKALVDCSLSQTRRSCPLSRRQMSTSAFIYATQKLLGHSNARTNKTYTHTVKSVTIKDGEKSPPDFLRSGCCYGSKHFFYHSRQMPFHGKGGQR